MDSNDGSVRDRVLAELAALGAGSGDALELLREVRGVAVFADQVLGQLARLAGLVDSSGAYAEAGYPSAAAFLRHGCGRSAGRAGELVAVGRAYPRLAATGQAVAAGELSFDAAHVICRAAGQIDDPAVAASAEKEMLSVTGLDPRELRRLGEDLVYRADPEAVEAGQRKRFERRYLSFGLTLDGVGTISGACSDGLSVEIIKTAAKAFGPPGGAEDQRTAAQRRMDGLTAACQAALDSGKAGTRHGAMPHVSVLLDAQEPPDPETRDTGGTGPGTARTANGTLLTAAQILTLACRAEVSVIRWREGLPLDVGRRYRTETPAQRRALEARDRGCRWPGCGLAATWCTAHHIRPWKRRGRTRLPNLVLLCFVHHHYFIHLLGWILTGEPDAELRFTHPKTGLTLTSPLPALPTSRGP